MSLFMIDTGAVSASMSSIESLVSKFENLSSKLDGLDVSCDDDFDFAGAKAAIAANISACSTKISNVSKTIENVVNAHTSLQGSLKFDSSASSSNASASSNSGGTTSYSSHSSSSGSYSASSTSYSASPSSGYSASSGGGYSASSGGGYNVSSSGGTNVSTVGGYNVSSGNLNFDQSSATSVVIPSSGNSMFIDSSSVIPVAGAGAAVASSGLVPSQDLVLEIITNRYTNEDDKTMGIQETNEYYEGQIIEFTTGSGSNVWYAIQGATTRWRTDDAGRLAAKKYGLAQLPEGAYETEDGLYIPGCSFKLAPLVSDSEGIVGLPAKGAMSVIMPSGTAKPDLWKHGYSLYSKRGDKPYYGINEIKSQSVANASLESSLTSKISYDTTGYATIEGRYVISCDDYFGRVGDKVQVYTDNGPIECVIGYTAKENSGRLSFFTDDSFDSLKLNDKITLANIKSINNLEYANGGWKDEYGYSAEGHTSLLSESEGDN